MVLTSKLSSDTGNHDGEWSRARTVVLSAAAAAGGDAAVSTVSAGRRCLTKAGHPRSATEGCGMMLAEGNEESEMPKAETPAIERIIANTINKTARGDPDELAARIVAALTEAGVRIVSADGGDDTALAPQRPDARQLYRSPNGDTGLLARVPGTGAR